MELVIPIVIRCVTSRGTVFSVLGIVKGLVADRICKGVARAWGIAQEKGHLINVIKGIRIELIFVSPFPLRAFVFGTVSQHDQLIKDLKTESIFGQAIGVVYTIEFKKRGLPHAHILLWIDRADINMSANSIDDFISAEIPSKKLNPELYNAVSEYMVHGPCGPLNPASPCMHDGKKCSKKFPKSFNERTMFDGNGYPVYRRRDTGDTVDKNGNLIDNRFIVPYNPFLLMKYQAHINVEWCNKTNSIKYLFNYVNKGVDRIGAKITVKNEVKDYVECRYISACEAVWRIMGYDIHYKDPPVERLSFHMEGEQSVTFKDGDLIM
ncbi:hypothetical protein OROMI_033811 [Orobanche minor]